MLHLRFALILIPFAFAGTELLNYMVGQIGYFATSPPSPSQKENITRSLEILSKTKTGRNILSRIEPSKTDRGISASDLSNLGIEIRIGAINYLGLNALVFERMDSGQKNPSKNDFFLIVSREIVDFAPGTLTPIIGHEMAHIIDRREAPAGEKMASALERRGYLIQTHITAELLDMGLLPSPDPIAKPKEFTLIRGYRFTLDVWAGKPLNPLRYGKINAKKISRLNEEAEKNPGLPALLAFADFKHSIGDGVPGWDAQRRNLSAYVQSFDAKLAREDRMFRSSRAAKALVRRDKRLRDHARRSAEAKTKAITRHLKALRGAAVAACNSPAGTASNSLLNGMSYMNRSVYSKPFERAEMKFYSATTAPSCADTLHRKPLTALARGQRPDGTWLGSTLMTQMTAAPAPVFTLGKIPQKYPRAGPNAASQLAWLAQAACRKPGSVTKMDVLSLSWFPDRKLKHTKSQSKKLSGCSKYLYDRFIGFNRTFKRGTTIKYKWINTEAAEFKARERQTNTYTPPPQKRSRSRTSRSSDLDFAPTQRYIDGLGR